MRLWTVASDFNVPVTTRSIVMRPAKGSAIVFQTNAVYGAASLALIPVGDPSSVERREVALGRRRDIAHDGVEQRLDADGVQPGRADERENLAGPRRAAQPFFELRL